MCLTPLFQSENIKIHSSKYGKIIGQIHGRISMRRLVRNLTIQRIIINLPTKYDYSSLHGYTAIFEEKNNYSKYGNEENVTKTGKKKHQNAWFAISQYNSSLSTSLPDITTQTCTVLHKSLTKNFIIQSMERKKIGQIQGRISRSRPGWIAIPRYNTLS